MATKRDPRVAIDPSYAAEARRTRRPQLRFNLRTLPYQLQPFMCHPVLPGETLSALMLQAQIWSDPLKADQMKNIGWWNHYNFFYIKHRDLPEPMRSDLANMMLEPGHDMTGYHRATANWKTFAAVGAIDWAMECLKHVTEEYFRDEGESWDHATLDGLPLAKIWGKGSSDVFDKLTLDADYEDRRVKLNDDDGNVYVDDVNKHYQHWAAMKDAGLIAMDYQDFMKAYGVTVREEETSVNLHRAEDLGAIREFTYPTNTVEPTTGEPATAVGWRVQTNAPVKRAHFTEPGFILGLTYTRPKIYLRGPRGSVAGFMDHVLNWLPPQLHSDNDASHVHFEQNTGPLPSLVDDGGYWLDLRDLLVHGEHFINYDPATAAPFTALPAVDGQRRYAAESEIKALFASESGMFTTDGLATPSIIGRQAERTKNLVLGQS